MVRALVIFALVPALAWSAAPAAKPAQAVTLPKPIQLSAEQQKSMHWGCVNACKPSPVESKCATACEALMYQCIDHTGPNETPKDTEACQAKVLKKYEETKGVEKKEEKKDAKADKKGDKKEAKKEEKKAKSFLQVQRKLKNIDDENAEAAEMARLEAQSDKDMGEDDDETASSDDSEDKSDDEESFVQVKRNIDDENAEAAEMARLEAQSDKDMGEDDDETASSDDSEDKADDEESFVQVKRNIDDENAEAAEMARLEAQSDKDMGEDDDETASSDDSEDKSDDEESFVQVKRNIDDENAEAAEMARLEAQSDKDMGEDDDETASTDDSEDKSDDEESFVQVKRNIDDENAEAAEMARLEAQSDKDMGEDDDETSSNDDSEQSDESEESE